MESWKMAAFVLEMLNFWAREWDCSDTHCGDCSFFMSCDYLRGAREMLEGHLKMED